MVKLRGTSAASILLVMASSLFLLSCGGSSGGGGQKVQPPATPTGLAATAGNAQVSLTWNASSGATSYTVGRGTVSGGPYSTTFSASTASYTDSTAVNGTTYYYVVDAANSAGTSANSSQVSATPAAPAIPATPTGLAATPGNNQVSLTWNASTGATSYTVGRGIVSGGPYSTTFSASTASYTDTTASNGTTYFYVVAASNSAGTSANSGQVSATPAATNTTNVAATIDVLANRHAISPYIYGGAFPQDAPTITDSGLSVVRWGGNAASTYNWELGTDNADNDYYFEDFTFGALNDSADSDSTQFIKDVKAAGSAPLMTMVMLPWVAQSPETSTHQGNPLTNYHWSFSVTKYGAQCSVDQYNPDAGDGLKPDCKTQLTADPNDAYFPLLDQPGTGDPANSVYRSQWAAALATAFGSSPHFYDMDNEIDIWGGTHFDIHPNPSGYDELANTYVLEANNLKTWDPAAIRLGPVSCCWWFYFNGANGNDKDAHGGVDFLPWWLNEVYWKDQISGTRSLDVFDIHAYPDANTSGLNQAGLQALATSIYRDYWDPTYVSTSSTINQIYVTKLQPNYSIPFRIPRMRAILNQNYPGAQFSITEWSAAFAGTTSALAEADFSTALGDADAYGILGRERVYLASRWTAPVPTNPNYQALKLYTNYDNSHHGFGATSVEATHNGDPNLFSTYAALNSTGTTLTIMVLNKDPVNAAQVTFTTTGFTPINMRTYTLSQSSPFIVAGTSQSWPSSLTFAPYTATLMVVSGSMASTPASAWDIGPDTMMVPANGTVTLHPILITGTATVTLSSPVFDSFEGAPACTGGTITLTTPTITTGAQGEITVNAGSTPGFCHFTVTGTDSSGVTQTEGGWIVVGNPAATLAKTGGDAQTGAVSTLLPQALTVTLSPGSSGGTNTGASVLFTTSAGSLSNGTTSGAQVIAVTNSSGIASVTLTLPSTAQTVTVNAEGPYGLGHPVAPQFTETATP